jgi:hypothetical protein
MMAKHKIYIFNNGGCRNPLSMESILRDVEAWLSFRLETAIKYKAGTIGPTYTDGYSYVEIPEWEARQKLDNVRQRLNANEDAIRCANCGSADIHDISGEYETGVVAPDGYRERLYEEAFHCDKCGRDQEYV